MLGVIRCPSPQEPSPATPSNTLTPTATTPRPKGTRPCVQGEGLLAAASLYPFSPVVGRRVGDEGYARRERLGLREVRRGGDDPRPRAPQTHILYFLIYLVNNSLLKGGASGV